MTTQTKTTWRKVKLGEVTEIIDGDRGTNYPRKDELLKSGYCVFLDAKNVSGTKFDFNSVQFISERKHNLMRKGQLERGDFVLTTRGTVGNIAYFNTDIPYNCMRINSGMVIFRPKHETITDDFFYSFLISREFRDQVEALKTGSAQPQLPIRDIKLFEIVLPPTPNQNLIAGILSAFDDKIELNNKISVALEQMAQAIFKEWFVKFRFPGHEKVKMIDSELGKIPHGWEVKKIKDVCDQIVNGGTPRREVREYWANGNIPWVTTSELQDQVIIETTEKISKIGYENSSAKLLPQTTIIIALYASPTLGRLGLLKIEATTNQACSALVAKDEIGYGYLFYWLLNQREYLRGLAVGAAQQNINQEVIRELNILVPDNQLLKRFQEVVSRVFDTLTNSTRENQKLAALRDLLLPKLMSGEIGV